MPLWSLLAAPLSFIIVFLAAKTPLVWMLEKPVQEIVAPVVVGLAAIAALASHYWVRQTYSLILACFVCSLFLREWHFEGTDPGIYYVLLALCYWASVRREQMAAYCRHLPVRALFSAAFVTYFAADLVDRHAFVFLEPLLGPENIWQNHVEETMETLGHAMIFGLVLATLQFGAAGTDRKISEPGAAAAVE